MSATSLVKEASVHVWQDNETDQDLLGFRVHADLIRSVITDEATLPVTVGLFGSAAATVLRRAPKMPIKRFAAGRITSVAGACTGAGSSPKISTSAPNWVCAGAAVATARSSAAARDHDGGLPVTFPLPIG